MRGRRMVLVNLSFRDNIAQSGAINYFQTVRIFQTKASALCVYTSVQVSIARIYLLRVYIGTRSSQDRSRQALLPGTIVLTLSAGGPVPFLFSTSLYGCMIRIQSRSHIDSLQKLEAIFIGV